MRFWNEKVEEVGSGKWKVGWVGGEGDGKGWKGAERNEEKPFRFYKPPPPPTKSLLLLYKASEPRKR